MRKLAFIIFLCVSSLSICSQNNEGIQLIERLKKFDVSITETIIQKVLKKVQLLSKHDQAELYTQLGNYYYVVKRDNNEAFRNFYLALEINDISNYTKANAHNGLGVVFSAYYQNDLAIKNYKNSLRIMLLEFKDSISDINSLYNNIGKTFSDENYRDSAYYYYKKGIVLGQKHNSPAFGCLFNMGYLQQNQDSAYYYTKRAFDTAKQQGNNLMMTLCWLNLGAIETSRGNLAEADSLLRLSAKNAIANKQDKYLNEINLYQAFLEIEKNNPAIGVKKIEKELTYFKTKQDYDQLTRSYEELEKGYLKLNNFKKAYLAYKSLNKIDSTKKALKKIQIAKGVSIFEDYKDLFQKQKDKLQKDKLFYTQLIAFLLLLILVSVIFFNRYKRVQREKITSVKFKNAKLATDVTLLKDESKQINQELLFKSVLMSEKKSFLEQLSEDIKQNIKLSKSVKEKEYLRNIYRKIQLNIKENIGNEFEYMFNKVHPNFYKTINEMGINLTNNEMRLSALIKLNFNTKEISDITKQSTNTINVAKSRLKTKLQIDKNSSLYTHIQNIDK